MSPIEIVQEMMKHDRFSQWLSISIDTVDLGSCTISCIVREEMLNGHHIAHGGISYALSDSALAFAANTHGFKCVSFETSISHLEKVETGDQLVATCTELSRGKTIGVYQVEVHSSKRLISTFKGTVHISQNKW